MFLRDEEVLKEFEPHINENGMVPYGPPHTVTQNDTLFSAYYLLAVENALGTVPEKEKVRLRAAYEKHILEDGLTKRTPTSTELESHDNLTGWGLAAVMLDRRDWAKRILSYARNNGWIYPDPDEKDEKRRWLGRHRVLEPHLMMAAGEKPDYLMQLVWVGTVLSALKGIGDSYSLTYVLVETALKSNPPLTIQIAAEVWLLAQRARNLNLGENLDKYYGWGGSPHVKYLKYNPSV
jgi:hypothetical protein